MTTEIGDGGYLLDEEDFYLPEDEQPEAELKQAVKELLDEIDFIMNNETGLDIDDIDYDLVERIRELL